MKEYRDLNAIELSLDADFIRWVQNAAPADRQFWESWLDRNPDRRSTLEEARLLVQSIDINHEDIDNDMIQQEIDKLLRTVDPVDNLTIVQSDTHEEKGSKIHPLRRMLLVAAAIAAVIGVRYFETREPETPVSYAYTVQTAAKHLIERVNRTDKTDSLILPDGSRIWLGPKSRISYALGWDTIQTREVYLSGEALFDVARHPNRPFRVITGEVVTKVLGTRFCVRSFEKDTTIQVTVRSGKVSVTGAQTDPGGILVTCNQRVVYRKSAQKFQKMLLDQPAIVVPTLTDENMIYEDTPIEQVFSQLGRAYGIGIMYDNELMKKCTVTADLKGETFYHKLDLICKAIGASYEVVDGLVIIQSAGCQTSPSG